jgi:hypothetical protein
MTLKIAKPLAGIFLQGALLIQTAGPPAWIASPSARNDGKGGCDTAVRHLPRHRMGHCRLELEPAL